VKIWQNISGHIPQCVHNDGQFHGAFIYL